MAHGVSYRRQWVLTPLVLLSFAVLCAALVGLAGLALFVGRWLPNDGEVVFVQRSPEKGDLYALDLQRHLIVNLTRSPERDLDPAWSPDGSRLAFVSYRGSPFPVIYLMDADGRNVRRVSGAGSTSPAWSPDGAKLAFVVEGHIYMMNADGGQTEQLTFQFLTHHSPVWSPDGREIAFVSWRNATAGMYALDLQTRAVRRLSYVGGSPDWGGSVAGGQIVFEHTRGSYTNLYVLAGDAAAPAQALTDSRHNIDPAWSPDNAQIAYVTLREDGSSTLCLMALLPGESPSVGTSRCSFADKAMISQPSWRP